MNLSANPNRVCFFRKTPGDWRVISIDIQLPIRNARSQNRQMGHSCLFLTS